MAKIAKLEFIEDCNFNIVNPKQFRLKDLNSEYFSKMRLKYLKFDIFETFSNASNFQKIISETSEEGGRSNSCVFITHDNRFAIKTISKEEYTFFNSQLIHSYMKRVLGCDKSRLIRIYSCLFFESLDQYVIIMESIISDKQNSLIFDLKGSKSDRNVLFQGDIKEPPKGIVLKDENFRNYGRKVILNAKKIKNLKAQLQKDFWTLCDSGVMDYSIILCFNKDIGLKEMNRASFREHNGDIVTLVVIDILQAYDLKKFGETTAKSIFNKKKDVSSVEPEFYFQRLVGFLDVIFASNNNSI